MKFPKAKQPKRLKKFKAPTKAVPKSYMEQRGVFFRK